MRYEKPQIVFAGSAHAGIQGSSKMGSAVELSERPTVSAYEADE
jgi:hypothetical protein